MDVAGEDHHVVDALVDEVVVEAVPLSDVPVPLVGVEGVGRPGLEEQGEVGQVDTDDVLGVGQGPHVEGRQHHLLAHEAPSHRARLGRGELVEPEGALLGGDELSVGIPDLLLDEGHPDRPDLLVTSVQASVEHDQIDEVPVPERSVDAAGLVDSDRHPLLVGLLRPGLPLGPVALLARRVVPRPVAPRVVGRFVVIPGGDEREQLVDPARVDVELVLAVALAVVGQGHDLRGGIVGAVLRETGRAGPALVEVVAQVDDGIEIVPAGQGGVGVEEAVLVVGAADDTEAQALDDPDRRRLGAPGDRAGPLGGEAVEVPLPCLEATHVDLHGVVPLGPRRRSAPCDDIGEGNVARHHPADFHRTAVVGRDARPQQHAVGERVS